MSLIEMTQCRLERCAELLCANRNKSMPVELGKSLYELDENSVVFSKAHYLLDSVASSYTSIVAKVELDLDTKMWMLFVPNEEDKWIPYPFLARSADLTAIMREIEKDPKSYFW